ncbi:MAG: hypothetical protein DRJ49_02490 [Thermoprotei archaeon]|nr:MAG: hypothetical protein DRN53_00900 [Thermoprotei archaeon]RLE89592.1 MAG: hypothetical protein DRJ49_02490 [Thermoprotei archaeon]
MRILVLTQGFYGERIVRNLRTIREWNVNEVKLPHIEFETALDEPETVEMEGLEDCDILLLACEETSVPLLIPTITERISVKSIIVAVDNPRLVGIGLENLLKYELKKRGITCIFARPLCSLTPCEDKHIDEFTKYFGRPTLEVTLDEATGTISSVRVRRSAPCGSTYFVARKLVGVGIDDAERRAAILLQCYPCLAACDVDPILKERTIDYAAHLIANAVRDAVESACR